jgi:hypothetical protein
MTHERQQLSPAPAEQNSAAQTNLETAVTDLLNNPELNVMSPEAQGRFIVDRFIGAAVAAHQRGEFAQASTPFQTPTDVLKAISGEASIADNRVQLNDRYVTRTGGLRGAAQQLAMDHRTAGWLPILERRLMPDSRGETRLASLDQVDGYLLAVKPGYTSWKEPLSRDMRKAVAYQTVPEWKSNTPMHYGGQELQRQRSTLRNEITKADGDGVDLYLLENAVATINHLNGQYTAQGQQPPIVRRPEDPIIGLPQQDFDDFLRA